MKSGIHPEYKKALITCACGRSTETRSTVGELHVEICSHCHPFFTGRQKLVDTAGRVERFMAKYGIEDEGVSEETATRAEESEAAPREEVREVTGQRAGEADGAEADPTNAEAAADGDSEAEAEVAVRG